jgi:dTDP-glucose pyrophosphorylase/predicted transcriptional regulator
VKEITIHPSVSIRQAMTVLEKTSEKCLLVAGKNNKLIGTLTDGDLRRSILNGAKFSDNISKSYNVEPIVLIQDEYDPDEAKQLLKEYKIDLIPVIDKNNLVVNYITWSFLVDGHSKTKKSLDGVPVVIMAGGRGSRLDPFTKILPKPLVPIHEKPIIEHIIERFTNLGCSDFHLTVNYKSRILKAYFDELQPNYDVNFVEEQYPMGTAGSLRFLWDKFKDPFFVTNCDIIIKADYSNLYEFHQKGNYFITLVASAKEYIIPYGICKLGKDGHLSHIHEKPQYDLLINTGLYVLNPEALRLIPENKLFHITDLIEDAIKLGNKVGVFPIEEENWIDVGQWNEYRQASERL